MYAFDLFTQYSLSLCACISARVNIYYVLILHLHEVVCVSDVHSAKYLVMLVYLFILSQTYETEKTNTANIFRSTRLSLTYIISNTLCFVQNVGQYVYKMGQIY